MVAPGAPDESCWLQGSPRPSICPCNLCEYISFHNESICDDYEIMCVQVPCACVGWIPNSCVFGWLVISCSYFVVMPLGFCAEWVCPWSNTYEIETRRAAREAEEKAEREARIKRYEAEKASREAKERAEREARIKRYEAEKASERKAKDRAEAKESLEIKERQLRLKEKEVELREREARLKAGVSSGGGGGGGGGGSAVATNNFYISPEIMRNMKK